MEVVQQFMTMGETPIEAESRRERGFPEIEAKLGRRFNLADLALTDMLGGALGSSNPLAKAADPEKQTGWLFDNTAFQSHDTRDSEDKSTWQAEFVASFFYTEHRDISETVSNIADIVRLDDSARDATTIERITKRLAPFVWPIAPGRKIDINIPTPDSTHSTRSLGPSNANGISSELVEVNHDASADGTTITCSADTKLFPTAQCQTRFAGPEGWAVISDIDDTIKITGSVDPIGILEKTFVEKPQTTDGMPQFYKDLDQTFRKPVWFYLSASPYNLYPFLHEFLTKNYPPGTMILRDSSWMYLGGLLQSLTQGVQSYKVDRMKKIHGWLPSRKYICIGDSTQSDPEAYAEIYNRYPGFVKAIFIRKVLDPAPAKGKNDPGRFVKAFKEVPENVWTVFVTPNELSDHVRRLTGEAHTDVPA